jgi:signal transduction histidine kinase
MSTHDLALTALPLPIVISDREGHPVAWSDELVALLGPAVAALPSPDLAAILTSMGVADADRLLQGSLAARQDLVLRRGGGARRVGLRSTGLDAEHRLHIFLEGPDPVTADAERAQFQSLIAHDLRQPLAVIQGYAGLLATGSPGPLNDTQREFLAGIDAKIGEVTRLLDDFLDLSRLEAGALVLHPQDTPLAELVARVLGDHQTPARARQLRLECEVEPHGLSVMADPLRLRQILDNLVSNAVKYNRDGGWVRVEAVGDDRIVRLTVADGGPGLTARETSDLFAPFARGHATSGEPGTGLGLVVVKRLVELHGGDIAVESNPGVGSRFVVELPRVAAGDRHEP